MPTYSVDATVAVASNEGDIGFDLNVAVLRDAVEIGRIFQFYGRSVTNVEMAADMRAKVVAIVDADYDGLARTALLERAAAIEAALDSWTKALP
jgi:hypothetical protein